jgi:hypothetical protein
VIAAQLRAKSPTRALLAPVPRATPTGALGRVPRALRRRAAAARAVARAVPLVGALAPRRRSSPRSRLRRRRRVGATAVAPAALPRMRIQWLKSRPSELRSRG